MANSFASHRKLVIIGDGACGKTSLLSVFTLGYFPTVRLPLPRFSLRYRTRLSSCNLAIRSDSIRELRDRLSGGR